MMNYKVKTLKKMLCIKQDVWEDLEAITPKGNSTQDLIRHMIKRCLYDRVWSQYYIRSSKRVSLKRLLTELLGWMYPPTEYRLKTRILRGRVMKRKVSHLSSASLVSSFIRREKIEIEISDVGKRSSVVDFSKLLLAS